MANVISPPYNTTTAKHAAGSLPVDQYSLVPIANNNPTEMSPPARIVVQQQYVVGQGVGWG